MERLGEAIATAQHQFWTDDVSLLDSASPTLPAIHGPRPGDRPLYVALAVRHRGASYRFELDSAERDQGAEKKHMVRPVSRSIAVECHSLDRPSSLNYGRTTCQFSTIRLTDEETRILHATLASRGNEEGDTRAAADSRAPYVTA